MTDLHVWVEEKLLSLNLTETMNKPDWFTRLSFSPEEKAAHRQFRNIADDLGLDTYQG